MNLKKIISFFKENKWNLGLQLLFWIGTYIVWLHFATFRFWTSLPVEHIVFWILFLAVNIHNWVLFPRLYQRQYIKTYFIATSLLFLGTILIEYNLAAEYILARFEPEEQIPKYIVLTKFEILGGVSIRDFMFFLVFILSYLYRDSVKYQRIQAKEIKNIKESQQAKDEMLYYLCHEHFTENALAILSYRFPDDPKKTKMLLSRLFKIYKYSFSKISEDIVPVEEELRFAKSLIEYYQTIFPDSKVDLDIRGEIPPFSVPPLITESIIGNAFKHGITNISGEIKIIFDFTTQFFFSFTCSNKYEPSNFFKDPNSRGLKLVEERINLMYKKDAFINWAGDQEYFTTSIRLPL